MPAVSRLRLHSLAEREFKREAISPAPAPVVRNFRALKLSLAKFDPNWDRKRGSAARMMALLLREGDDQLTVRVCESESSAKTYGGAADWLTSEARYLRKLAGMMDTASGRLAAVLQRCGHTSVPTSNV